MNLAQQFEEYRRQQLRGLKQENERIDAEAAQLAAKLEGAKAKKLEVQQKAFRLEDNPPTDDTCPDCFFHGRTPSSLNPIPSADGVDRFRCRQCGYETEVEA